MEFWSEHNELDEWESVGLPDLDEFDGSHIVFERYWSTNSENEVWLYRVEGGGHDWPGETGNMDIHASVEIWNFFSLYLD